MDSEHWAGCAVDDVAHAMHTGSSGLGDPEARTRLERYGPNAMRAHHVSALAVLGRQFRNAVLIMLLVTA
ncbi:MAG: cation-transporting P-type ATPase, partial [Bifidobacterium sp.]|nr:cation-transporting P-type ATPase [Bifidobacterium sp.]